MNQAVYTRTDPQTLRTKPVLVAAINAGYVVLSVGALVGLYFALKSFFVYLVAAGLGLAGCWVLTLVVGFVALAILARIMVALGEAIS